MYRYVGYVASYNGPANCRWHGSTVYSLVLHIVGMMYRSTDSDLQFFKFVKMSEYCRVYSALNFDAYTRTVQKVWRPGSADTVCPRRAVMTHVYNIGPRQLTLITWPCDLDLWPWPSTLEVMAPLWLMRVIVLHPYTKFEVRRPCHSEDMAHDMCEH